MATSTDVPIYTITLSSTTSSLDIDLSPYQQYKNLKIVMNGTLTGTGAVYVQFNGDTASNYSSTYVQGQSGVSSGRDSAIYLFGLLTSGSGPNVGTSYIMNYSSNSGYKTVISRAGDITTVNANVGLWRGTPSAITSLTLKTSANNFAIGTTFSVYGIGSATASTKATGGAIYSDANYMYHVFTSTGTFTPTQSLTADVLVIAGGGGGGSAAGGGGGAGGLLVQTGRSCSSGTAYTVTVGAAGSGATGDGGSGFAGGNSAFDTITALGGGGGSHNTTGASGGSGGGGGYGPTSGGSATQGNSGGATGYGYAGGGNSTASGLPYSAGGGGGAGAVGGTGNSSQGGDGGIGRTEAFFNAIGLATGAGETVNGLTYFAGGGGGSRDTVWGAGGLGGGGKGGSVINASTNSKPAKGKINTGGGGGGGNSDGYYNGPSNNAGVPGGSGIVVVRYAK